LGISRSGGARNPHVFQYTLRFLRSGGTRPSFARDGFFTNSQKYLRTAPEQSPLPAAQKPALFCPWKSPSPVRKSTPRPCFFSWALFSVSLLISP
ncbi:MAG: hypothetical protein ACREYE_24510, partial [Gammaproteobacteria bacterium]